MNERVIGFRPPFLGLDGIFNTFRMGIKLSRDLSIGEVVCLLDEKDKMIIGKAEVLDIDQGNLGEMCLIHARDNHQELNSDSIYAPQRVFSTMQKFHGPHIATVQRKATVIYLRRIE